MTLTNLSLIIFSLCAVSIFTYHPGIMKIGCNRLYLFGRGENKADKLNVLWQALRKLGTKPSEEPKHTSIRRYKWEQKEIEQLHAQQNKDPLIPGRMIMNSSSKSPPQLPASKSANMDHIFPKPQNRNDLEDILDKMEEDINEVRRDLELARKSETDGKHAQNESENTHDVEL